MITRIECGDINPVIINNLPSYPMHLCSQSTVNPHTCIRVALVSSRTLQSYSVMCAHLYAKCLSLCVILPLLIQPRKGSTLYFF